MTIGALLAAMTDYIYALEGLPEPDPDDPTEHMAKMIRQFAERRRVSFGVPSRDDAIYKYYRDRPQSR
jgi:hypothetical protein